eukprot:4384326-Heterocapsa_arctica.AAC.1
MLTRVTQSETHIVWHEPARPAHMCDGSCSTPNSSVRFASGRWDETPCGLYPAIRGKAAHGARLAST